MMDEQERLKNKVLQLNSENTQLRELRAMESLQHKKDIRVLMDRIEHQDEEETYITCKDSEVIESLEREITYLTEKTKLIRCLYLAYGLIIGVVLKAVI